MQKFKFKLFKLSFDNLQRNPLNEHIGSEHGAHETGFARTDETEDEHRATEKRHYWRKVRKKNSSRKKTQEIVFQSEKNDEEQGKSSSV
jgi:hypothetical protein